MKPAVILAVLLITLLAIGPAFAGFSLRQVTTYGVDSAPSADDSGWFLASINGQGRHIFADGASAGNGLNDVYGTVRFGSGVAYFNATNLLPVVANSYPTPVWGDSPLTVGARVSQDEQHVVFARQSGRVMVVDRTCGVTKDWTAFDGGHWIIDSLDWGPDGLLYVSAQDRFESQGGGYHLLTVDPVTGATSDHGLSYMSALAISGNDFLFSSYDHSSLSHYQWTPSGLQFKESLSAIGVDQWYVGGARESRFAIQDGRGRLWEAFATVPEPSSLLALGAMLTPLLVLKGRRSR